MFPVLWNTRRIHLICTKQPLPVVYILIKFLFRFEFRHCIRFTYRCNTYQPAYVSQITGSQLNTEKYRDLMHIVPLSFIEPDDK